MDNNINNYKMLHRGFAAVSFIVIFIIFALTVQPSVPFWDCGEFLCAMTYQQVPHPPGAPLFAILGGVVQVLMPFGNMGWQGNMMSVVASAFTVLLLYLTSVIAIKALRKEPIEKLSDALTVFGAAFVGALGFGFTCTFWFNGVESEVYATGILNVAIVLYLIMRWTEVADEKYNERYLLLCIYITGLSVGVHLLSMLVLFTVILLVYFRKYPVTIKSFLIMSVIGLLSYKIVISEIAQNLPAYLAGRTSGRNDAMEFSIENSVALQAFTVAVICGLAAFWVRSYKKKKAVNALISMSLLLVIFGFSVFAHVVIRTNTNSPLNMMDMNKPNAMAALASYIQREQYGEAPQWPRRYQEDPMMVSHYNKQDKNGNYVYGQWNEPGRKVVSRKDGSQVYAYDWSNANVSGELSFMWKYQMNQMYFRYFFWNFVGRMSDVQDEGVAWFDTKGKEEANYKTGNLDTFYPVQYWALPLIFGLIGLYYHFKKNPKYALAYFLSFLAFGVATALFQNQQEPQPRERDYFYVGSFIIWGLWMAIGSYAITYGISKKVSKSPAVVVVVLIACFIMVPFNLVSRNYSIYGRAGKWLTFDYAYNVLQSVEQDAILFTNGDNDTFPVWYMQDVEGVRRDVRIANLSLGQTLWYVNRLKNQMPWGAKKVPMSFSDASLCQSDEYSESALRYEFGGPKTDVISVSRDILAKFTDDANIINNGAVTFTFIGKENRKDEKGNQIYFFGVNHKLVRDVIITNKFERPIYFISSAGTEAMCGLDKYMRIEGLVRRVCPVVQNKTNGNEAYNEEVMDAILLNVDNTENFSKTPKYGLKLRNLDNPNICYDETDRRTIMMNYPDLYIGYARYLTYVKGDYKRAALVMDTYLKYLPLNKIPLPAEYEREIASVYDECKDKSKAKLYAEMCIKSCEEQIANENLNPRAIQYEQLGRYFGPYQIASEMYTITGQWDKAKSKLEQLIAKMTAIQQQFQQGGNNEESMQIGARAFSLQIAIDELPVDRLEQMGDINSALAEIIKLEKKLLSDTSNSYAQYFVSSITARRNELERKLGLKPTTRDTILASNN